MVEKNQNEWQLWSNYVLKELENLNQENKEMRTEISKIGIQLSQLQVKAGLWGAIAGAIPVIVVLLLKLLK